MDVIQIIVEGAWDVLFVKSLLSHMEPSLAGAWVKCTNDDDSDDSQIQPSDLTYKAHWKGRLLVIHAMNGVNSIFPMQEVAYKSLCYVIGEKKNALKIVKNILIVDADDTERQNGSGGIDSAKSKLGEEILKSQKLGISCAGFALPDNESDGTSEDLLSGMIPQSNRGVVDCCRNGFVKCAKDNGAKFPLSSKVMIDVYAKLFNKKANHSLFASSSFNDSAVWDWDSPVLDSLKQFVRTEILGKQ